MEDIGSDMKAVDVTGALALIHCSEDWYTVERKEHENRRWLGPTEYGMALHYSGRVSDADVEGTAAEMLEIAKAIGDRGYAAFTRCAVEVKGDHALLWSPRNSTVTARVSLAEADALAVSIRVKLGGAAPWP